MLFGRHLQKNHTEAQQKRGRMEYITQRHRGHRVARATAPAVFRSRECVSPSVPSVPLCEIFSPCRPSSAPSSSVKELLNHPKNLVGTKSRRNFALAFGERRFPPPPERFCGRCAIRHETRLGVAETAKAKKYREKFCGFRKSS